MPKLIRIVPAILAWPLLLAPVAAAEPGPKPIREQKALDLLDAALKATGDDKARRDECRVAELLSELPDKGRTTFSVKVFVVNEKTRLDILDTRSRTKTILVESGDLVWITIDGKLSEVRPDEVKARKHHTLFSQIFSIVPVKESASFSSRATGKANHENREYETVEVGHPDLDGKVKLYFDAKTHRLHLAAYEEDGKVKNAAVFEDYKQAGSHLRPFTITRYEGGKVVATDKYLKYEWPDALDASLFEKPNR